jgi:hypothetical protein
MKISSAFPSKFLRAADLQDQNINVTMSHVDMEDVGDTDKKPVLYFNGKEKGCVLNKTNSKVITQAYGDDTEAWRGKPLILYPAMVDFRGDMVEAIRVRIPKQPAANGTSQIAAQNTQYNEINPPPHETADIPF